MKLVIDIDERIVEDAKNGYRRLDEIADAVVKTGTPLPKDMAGGEKKHEILKEDYSKNQTPQFLQTERLLLPRLYLSRFYL